MGNNLNELCPRVFVEVQLYSASSPSSQVLAHHSPHTMTIEVRDQRRKRLAVLLLVGTGGLKLDSGLVGHGRIISLLGSNEVPPRRRDTTSASQ